MEHKPKARAGIPMTDGTPAPCRQKNAASFLAGDTPGVMASYGHGGGEPGGPHPPPERGGARPLARGAAPAASAGKAWDPASEGGIRTDEPTGGN